MKMMFLVVFCRWLNDVEPEGRCSRLCPANTGGVVLDTRSCVSCVSERDSARLEGSTAEAV